MTFASDWDIVFPDDEREANPASFKFLEMAHKWKRMQASGAGASSALAGVTATSEANGNSAAAGTKQTQDEVGDAEMGSSDSDED